MARAHDGGLALPFLAAVQRTFYAENRDVTASDEPMRIAETMGIGVEAFARAFAALAPRRAVAQELAQTAELGVTGYPTLLALQSGRPQVVSMGWRPYPDVETALVPLLGEATGD